MFVLNLIGDAGVGKTSFVRRILDGEFSNNPLDGDVILETKNNVNGVTVELKVIESSQIVNGCDGYMVMFDVTNVESFDHAQRLASELKDHPGIKVMCGNKVEVRERVVLPEEIRDKRCHLQYYDLSVRSCYNFDKPILYIASKLMNSSQVCLA